MKIFIASDHAGFELKEKLIASLGAIGHEVNDVGPASFAPDDDYPDYMQKLGRILESDASAFGIAIGKTGQGEAMALNRMRGVRAAVFYGGDREILKFSRAHNNANALSLGAFFLSEEDARAAISLWLSTEFSGDERHTRRNKKLDSIS